MSPFKPSSRPCVRTASLLLLPLLWASAQSSIATANLTPFSQGPGAEGAGPTTRGLIDDSKSDPANATEYSYVHSASTTFEAWQTAFQGTTASELKVSETSAGTMPPLTSGSIAELSSRPEAVSIISSPPMESTTSGNTSASITTVQATSAETSTAAPTTHISIPQTTTTLTTTSSPKLTDTPMFEASFMPSFFTSTEPKKTTTTFEMNALTKENPQTLESVQTTPTITETLTLTSQAEMSTNPNLPVTTSALLTDLSTKKPLEETTAPTTELHKVSSQLTTTATTTDKLSSTNTTTTYFKTADLSTTSFTVHASNTSLLGTSAASVVFQTNKSQLSAVTFTEPLKVFTRAETTSTTIQLTSISPLQTNGTLIEGETTTTSVNSTASKTAFFTKEPQATATTPSDSPNNMPFMQFTSLITKVNATSSKLSTALNTDPSTTTTPVGTTALKTELQSAMPSAITIPALFEPPIHTASLQSIVSTTKERITTQQPTIYETKQRATTTPIETAAIKSELWTTAPQETSATQTMFPGILTSVQTNSETFGILPTTHKLTTVAPTIDFVQTTAPITEERTKTSHLTNAATTEPLAAETTVEAGSTTTYVQKTMQQILGTTLTESQTTSNFLHKTDPTIEFQTTEQQITTASPIVVTNTKPLIESTVSAAELATSSTPMIITETVAQPSNQNTALEMTTSSNVLVTTLATNNIPAISTELLTTSTTLQHNALITDFSKAFNSEATIGHLKFNATKTNLPKYLSEPSTVLPTSTILHTETATTLPTTASQSITTTENMKTPGSKTIMLHNSTNEKTTVAHTEQSTTTILNTEATTAMPTTTTQPLPTVVPTEPLTAATTVLSTEATTYMPTTATELLTTVLHTDTLTLNLSTSTSVLTSKPLTITFDLLSTSFSFPEKPSFSQTTSQFETSTLLFQTRDTSTSPTNKDSSQLTVSSTSIMLVSTEPSSAASQPTTSQNIINEIGTGTNKMDATLSSINQESTTNLISSFLKSMLSVTGGEILFGLLALVLSIAILLVLVVILCCWWRAVRRRHLAESKARVQIQERDLEFAEKFLSDGEEAEFEAAVPLSISPMEGRARPVRVSRVEELDEIAPYESETDEQEQPEETEREPLQKSASEQSQRSKSVQSQSSGASGTGSCGPSSRPFNEDVTAVVSKQPSHTAMAFTSASGRGSEGEPRRREREGPWDSKAKWEPKMEPPVAFDTRDLLRAHPGFAFGGAAGFSHRERGGGRKGSGDRKDRGLEKMFTSVYLPSESSSGFGANARRKWYNSCDLLWMDED